MRALTYLVAVSLDGYIAAPDGGFDGFLMEGDHMAALVRDYPETLPGHVLAAAGLVARTDTFDTVVMGWNTFDVGLRAGQPNPYPHLRQVVCTRAHADHVPAAGVAVTADDPTAVVQRLKREDSPRGIWLCGGGRLAAALADEIDRLVLKVHPVVFGAGIRLFETDAYALRAFRLVASQRFESGVVVHDYARA